MEGKISPKRSQEEEVQFDRNGMWCNLNIVARSERAYQLCCSFRRPAMSTVLKTSCDLHYVVRNGFHPRGERFTVERGHLLKVQKGASFWKINDGPLEPSRFELDNGHEVRTSDQFDLQSPGFSHYVWGPYSSETYLNGLWYVRGQFGPNSKDLSLFQAGMQRKWYMDDIMRRHLISQMYFSALMGHELFTPNGIFVRLAETVDLNTVLVSEGG